MVKCVGVWGRGVKKCRNVGEVRRDGGGVGEGYGVWRNVGKSIEVWGVR